MPTKLVKGDRVAYAAKFLRNTCQFTGAAPQRRGTFLSDANHIAPGYCRVLWDDLESLIASGQGQYAETDYCEDSRRNGQLVCGKNIAKVGSARFSHNDL